MAMDGLPVLKKCCFCLPLRYGLLTWGYIKLAGEIIALIFYVIVVLAEKNYIIRNNVLVTILILIAVILPIEIILHVIFIIGGHKKNVKLLQAHYHYTIFTWIVTIIIFFGCTGYLIYNIVVDNGLDLGLIVVAFFCAIAGQTFFLISLRSEIIKLSSNCPYRFVKNENDPEGTINSVREEEEVPVDNGNGTTRIL